VTGVVLLAEPRGFCAGVVRAVAAVERALELHGPPVYVRHQIVHNTWVIRDLEAKGAVFVEDLAEVPEGSVVIFSAHGVPPSVRAEATAAHLKAIDATCPLVAKVHNEVVRLVAEDYEILLIGHAGHQEVTGTLGHAPGRIQLVEDPAAARRADVRDDRKVAWLSQTTLSADEVEQTVTALRARFPALAGPPSDDICYATTNRQAVVRQLAADADVVLVVGSANSSNSVRLAQAALAAGAPAAHLVDDATEIADQWLAGAGTVGVTAGASAPEVLVTEVLGRLAEAGFTDVRMVGTGMETQRFALPRELS
jgi:4-hydroxy-3-methylbut-2-en-1-yl diphosphate reductase